MAAVVGAVVGAVGAVVAEVTDIAAAAGARTWLELELEVLECHRNQQIFLLLQISITIRTN